MKQLENVDLLSKIKLISDPRRSSILKSLLAQPKTISQLGREFNKQPSWVRHHVKLLERAGLVRVSRVQVSEGYIEKYYEANAKAYFIQHLIVPDRAGGSQLVCLGSHDLALEKTIDEFQNSYEHVGIVYVPNGSLSGLIALRQGIAHVAGCHLLDPETGDYNRAYVRHIFPDRQVNLVTFAHRTQGLIFRKGNPKQIKILEDYSREDITIINRNPGSGTRIWLDRELRALSLPPERINGYQDEVGTHRDLANAIRTGKADVGLGLQAAAALLDLDFIPLFTERYDLIFPLDRSQEPAFMQFIERMTNRSSKQIIRAFPGYETGQTGSMFEM